MFSDNKTNIGIIVILFIVCLVLAGTTVYNKHRYEDLNKIHFSYKEYSKDYSERLELRLEEHRQNYNDRIGVLYDELHQLKQYKLSNSRKFVTGDSVYLIGQSIKMTVMGYKPNTKICALSYFDYSGNIRYAEIEDYLLTKKNKENHNPC